MYCNTMYCDTPIYHCIIPSLLDTEPSGASSDLIVPTRDVQKVLFLFFLHASSLRHSMDSTEIPSSIFLPTFHHKV